MVPPDQRWRLLATFNGGFTHDDGDNGSTDNGRVNESLRDGNAIPIGYRTGRIGIVRWSGGASAGPNGARARQSLPPIVWDGRLNPLLNTDPNSPQWGYTLGGVTRVWRTGVGVDRHGNLIYAVADDQTVVTIAKILQHAGAVRGMEFDLNPEWHTLITYSHQYGLDPKMVEPQPMQPATRYLVPDDRDFIADREMVQVAAVASGGPRNGLEGSRRVVPRPRSAITATPPMAIFRASTCDRA